jgi:hypothetical protein
MESLAALRAALAPLAAAFPQHKIVVRTHPVESATPWAHFISGIDNAVLDNTRSFPEQALAADAVIHLDGCGTGLEALLLGRPTVCLAPMDGLLDPSLALSSRTSPRARHAQSLIELVEEALREDDRPPTLEQAELIDQHLTRPAEGVSATIARHLAELFKRKVLHDPTRRPENVDFGLGRALEGVAGKMKQRELREAHTFSVKRVRVSEDDIRTTFAALGACLGRSEEMRVARVTDGYFILG